MKKYVALLILFSTVAVLFAAPAKPMKPKHFDDTKKIERAEEIGSADQIDVAEKLEDKFCTLIIESNAFMADVFINGIYKGNTKLELSKLRPGLYFVEVRKEGYERERFEVFLRRGETKKVYVTLELITGYIEFLNYSQGASVYVDNSLYINKKVVEVPIGKRVVKVTKFGYEPLETTVTVYPYETTGVSIELIPAVFYISNFKISKDRINPKVNGLSNCEISFYANANGKAVIKIEDENGNVVKQFNFERFTTWNNSVDWDGRDSNGNLVSDGRYNVILESAAGSFEGFIQVDSLMRYPVESFTCCGGGIGNYPTAFKSTMRTVKPSFGVKGIIKASDEDSGFYGCVLRTGVLFDIGKYVEAGIAFAGFLSDYDRYDFPIDMDFSVKVSNSIALGKNCNFGFGGVATYGFSNVFVKSDLTNGLGFGALCGFELPFMYAGLSSQFVFGAETGKLGLDSNVWKNAITLSFMPTPNMRLNGWCGINNFVSIDCGVEYSVVPGAAGFSLDLGANVLLYSLDEAYISGKLVLSYSF